jgi:hypothetical protein
MPRQKGGRADGQNPMPGQKACFKRLSARGNADTFCRRALSVKQIYGKIVFYKWFGLQLTKN